MQHNSTFLHYLCCPGCHAPFIKKGNTLFCRPCRTELVLKDGIIINTSDISEELHISSKKWDALYKKELQKKDYKRKYAQYMELYFKDVYDQLNEVKPIKDIVYLEIGCGEFVAGQEIADACKLIIGIDISANALRIAKHMLDEKGIHNYLLVQGDINRMPIRDGCIDLIYGGGVIEHFKDTLACLRELYRVLKRGGVSFNTVPYLNIGSLTYRQVWGNIPNFPVLKQIAELIHIHILGARHMIFGYEMSFTRTTLRKLHVQAGFKKTSIDRLRVLTTFDFAPEFLRPSFQYLAKKSFLFWPMVKAVGVKQ